MKIFDFATGFVLGKITAPKPTKTIPRIKNVDTIKYIKIDELDLVNLTVESAYKLYDIYSVLSIYKNGEIHCYKPVKVAKDDLCIDKTFILYDEEELYE